MDERLKQRLTGAAVLVSLAVIFIPMLLKGPAQPTQPDITATNIPPKPREGFQSRIIPLDGEKAAGAPAEVVKAAPAATAAPESGTSGDGQGGNGAPGAAAGTRAGSPPESHAGASPSASSGAAAPSASREPASTQTATVQSKAQAAPAEGEAPPQKALQSQAEKAPHAGEKEKVGVTAWAVQLGSFSNEKNAVALTGRLRKKGYTAFLETGSSDQGAVTRVFVGPELKRDEAVAAQKKLRDEFKLNGIVVRYPGG